MSVCMLLAPRKYMPRRSHTDEKLPPISRWLLSAQQDYLSVMRTRITQDKLAEAAGIDTTYIGKIEKGEKTPSVKVVKALAEALTKDWAEPQIAAQILQNGLLARRIQTEGEVDQANIIREKSYDGPASELPPEERAEFEIASQVFEQAWVDARRRARGEKD